jgi:translation initiation factor 5A
MVLRITEASQLRPGSIVLFEGEPYTIKSNDISKTGKHGHAKCRMQANGVFNDKRKVITVPGHERFEIPNVEKKRYQVLDISGSEVSAMDLESYETVDLPVNEDLRDQIQPEKQVEVWDIEGKKAIMRVL